MREKDSYLSFELKGIQILWISERTVTLQIYSEQLTRLNDAVHQKKNFYCLMSLIRQYYTAEELSQIE